MGIEMRGIIPGRPAEQVIVEVQEDLERGFYAKEDRDKAMAELMTAKISLTKDSSEYQEITRLLEAIATRYPDSQ